MRFLLLFHVSKETEGVFDPIKAHEIRDVSCASIIELETISLNIKNELEDAQFKVVLHQIIPLPEAEVPLGFNSAEE